MPIIIIQTRCAKVRSIKTMRTRKRHRHLQRSIYQYLSVFLFLFFQTEKVIVKLTFQMILRLVVQEGIENSFIQFLHVLYLHIQYITQFAYLIGPEISFFFYYSTYLECFCFSIEPFVSLFLRCYQGGGLCVCVEVRGSAPS